MCIFLLKNAWYFSYPGTYVVKVILILAERYYNRDIVNILHENEQPAKSNQIQISPHIVAQSPRNCTLST